MWCACRVASCFCTAAAAVAWIGFRRVAGENLCVTYSVHT
jgi:hypothetical protein